jgi:sulfide:quinone oxidoreductase
VRGVPDVFAAGDATQFPVKHGGLACQMADAAASVIAERAGASVEAEPFAPVLRGVLLTERGSEFMSRDIGRAVGDDATAMPAPLWWPPTKIAGRELARHLPVIRPIQRQAIPGVQVERALEAVEPALEGVPA